MPHSGSRLPKSEATRQRLLDCAVAEIVESGPDRIGFTAIAKRADMSTGALYARYENGDELVIDIWHERALPALCVLADNIVEACVGQERKEARRRLISTMNSRDPESMAAVLILVAARRNEVLHEVVAPSVSSLYDRTAKEFPVVGIMLAHFLGELLLIRGANLQNVDWSGVVGMLCHAAKTSLAHPIDVPLVDVTFPNLVFPELDEFDTALFTAVSDVIGRVGVENATISRIARKAAVNPASIYLRYADKNELLSRAVEIVLDAVAHGNDALNEGFVNNESVLSQSISMWHARAGKEYESVRNLRLELMSAAGQHESLSKVMAAKYAEMEKNDLAEMGFGDANADPFVRPFTLFNRALFFGQAILLSYGLLSINEEHFPSFMNSVLTTLAEGRARLTS